MPKKAAVAAGAATRAQSNQGHIVTDAVNVTEDPRSDVAALVATLTGRAMGDEIDRNNAQTEEEREIVKHLDLMATLDPDDFSYNQLTKKFTVLRGLACRTQNNTLMTWIEGTQVTYEEIMTSSARQDLV